jgi:hypothetical protein
MGARRYKPHSLLNFAEAGDVLGLSRWTMRDIADQGRITCFVLPGDLRRIRRVRYSELLAFQKQIEASATTGSRRGFMR